MTNAKKEGSQMNDKDYALLSEEMTAAMKIFRRVQNLEMARRILKELGETPKTAVLRLQFEVEYTERGGMINRKTFAFSKGDLFFGRTVTEFLAMVNGVQTEASEKFDLL